MSQAFPGDPQTMQAIGIVFCWPVKLGCKTLLLQMPQTFVPVLRKIKFALNTELSFCFLGFILLKYAMQDKEGKNIIDCFSCCEFVNYSADWHGTHACGRSVMEITNNFLNSFLEGLLHRKKSVLCTGEMAKNLFQRSYKSQSSAKQTYCKTGLSICSSMTTDQQNNQISSKKFLCVVSNN